ncbi:MAG: hypothetical protein AAGE96_09510 [Cyanobacteria bacterium P01_G01_bin.19]
MEKKKVLMRDPKAYKATYRSLRIRKGGEDGSFLQDESIHLSECADLLERLKDGQAIKC